MPIDVLMPALSPTMEKGNLAKWLKKEGDAIKSGDVIAEIETDKATMEVEAVDEGVLAKIVVPEGSADVPVNQLIALIAEEGEDVAGITAAAAATPAAPKSEAPATAPKADDVVLRGERPGATPGAVPSAPAPETGGQVGGQGGRIVASPLARRLAKQLGLDLADIAGSGPHGRIIERDVREAEKAGPKPKPAPAATPPAPAAAPAPVAASDESIRKMFEPGSYETVPHDGMRKTIARRLVEAKQTIPHFYLTVDCQLDALLALRGQINKAAPEKDGKPAYKISVNDMIIKALAMALQRVPEANATWTEGAMLRHKHSDVGVAVSIPGGLITPVVRKAEKKTLSVISNEMRDFAARAKNRKLKPEEYTGGSTAVSNLGMFGIKDFAAVINPPHATILAVGAGEQRVVVNDGAPAVATIMSVTLSTDHRAVDGALGAQLLDAFKQLIEAPMGMLV
ncbi:Dihydrolipoyllysine-residue acetyltransferase component of pyruvate dehydrogenase complex [Beijerinckiaceae bacterium RH AL1]|nr:pyruvate dehydrogenase complex dihydrolipoamide acetyltransferase [Beijerinckiaceae bacterium]VVB45867.1 Dihydrolipoyllysine-residue acetyltransferase component of pyruvate dehydrogenase complex [Beijerinckiaceae bacterium RH CH11]VVB45945.1 Dihydrolipoyllysine-residue acetyltransferase component of pyruvate dehydrogenase complex [Beijerinckiaceae bacterium RH AL8]VVC55081.1 Dihydrolipoyllysine-residue acetyltransferase component of pyruvate dehydrogenase complex [Beijerinckiaceae bacterium R